MLRVDVADAKQTYNRKPLNTRWCLQLRSLLFRIYKKKFLCVSFSSCWNVDAVAVKHNTFDLWYEKMFYETFMKACCCSKNILFEKPATYAQMKHVEFDINFIKLHEFKFLISRQGRKLYLKLHLTLNSCIKQIDVQI